MQTSRATRLSLPHLPWTALRVALCAVLALPAAIGAQSVLGVGDDAVQLPRGTWRVRTIADWVTAGERFGLNTPGRPKGSREPLGIDFNIDTLGVKFFENIAPIQASVRALAGQPEFTGSLGTSVLRRRTSVTSTPLSLELGLTNRISIGVLVPFVTATADIDFRINPAGREATLGFNPGVTGSVAATRNGTLVTELDNAAVALNNRIQTCTANPALPTCGPINANPAAARALVQSATAFANGVNTVYGGRTGAAGSLFVPVAGTVAQAAIEARLAGLKSQFTSYGQTVSSSGPSAGAPMTIADARHFLTDTAYGILAKPLATSITRGIGDIDLSVQVSLFDSFRGDAAERRAPHGFNWRQSVGATYRLGAGKRDEVDDFTDLGTGNHQNDIEIRSYTDLLWGPHFWVTILGRHNVQLADQVTMRIAEPDKPLAPAYRRQLVKRDLGDISEIEITPRWAFNDAVGLAAQYSFRRQGPSAYSGTFAVNDLNGLPVTINASILNAETEATEHRFGGGISYSTVAAHARGEARVPLEVSWLRRISVSGSGGNVPRLSQDQVQIRWYGRLFGR